MNQVYESGLRVNVSDINIIPQYKILFEGCYDAKLSRLHKEDLTQHQWRFEAVEPSVAFPLGCKVTYRAYASDRVVEILELPKDQCISSVGRATGLEPVTTYCSWWSSPSCDPNRAGIEGFYLLRKIPELSISSLPPCPFPDSIKADVEKTLRAVRSRWQPGNPESERIRNEWELWALKYAPLINSSEEYLVKMQANSIPYHIPLKEAILDSNFEVRQTSWAHDMPYHTARIDPHFVWPELLAAALPSVATSHNSNPPHSRVYPSESDELRGFLQEFKARTDDRYYGSILDAENKGSLELRLRRKVSYAGDSVSTTGIYVYHGMCWADLLRCCMHAC